jgi:hypothetical protein
MGMANLTELAEIHPPNPHRNVFSIYGTELPPNVLLMGKLLVAAFLISPQLPISDGYLPFVTALDGLVPHEIFRLVLGTVFVCAALCVLFNVSVRTSCFVAGSAVLVSMLASKPFYSNNGLFGGLLLVLAGLYEHRVGCWMLRLQVAIMYFGAGLNKLLEPDWRSGQFFQHWFGEIHQHSWFIKAGDAMPHLLFSQVTSFSIIVLELALVPALLYRRTSPLAIWTVIAYHTAILVLMGSTFGVFYYLIAASMLAFADWPQPPFRISFVSEAMEGFVVKLLRIIDPDEAFVVLATSSGNAHRLLLETTNAHEVGAMAVLRTLLLCPATYFLLLLLVKLPDSLLHLRRPVTIVAVLLFAPVPLISAARNFHLRTPAGSLGQPIPMSANDTAQSTGD